ncbi:MAG TPA: hypothetical protein VGD64_07465 [Acidisarcina sp.]
MLGRAGTASGRYEYLKEIAFSYAFLLLMRLVLDTNVVVSALFWNGPPRRLL